MDGAARLMANMPKLDEVSGPIVAAFLAGEPPLTSGGRKGEAEHTARLAAKLQERRERFTVVDLTGPHTPEDVACALEIARDSDAVFVLDVPLSPAPRAPVADGTAGGGEAQPTARDEPLRPLPLGCDDMGCY